MAPLATGRLATIRDRALLLVGFAGTFRRSELVALNVADIEETAEGLGITSCRSKTDKTRLRYARSDNTAGTLKVSDGIHTANIALLANYLASSFVALSDGHGGTLIRETPPTAQHTALAHPQITPLVAHRVISLPRGNSVAFGLKRTLGRIYENIAYPPNGTAFILIAPSRNMLV